MRQHRRSTSQAICIRVRDWSRYAEALRSLATALSTAQNDPVPYDATVCKTAHTARTLRFQQIHSVKDFELSLQIYEILRMTFRFAAGPPDEV